MIYVEFTRKLNLNTDFNCFNSSRTLTHLPILNDLKSGPEILSFDLYPLHLQSADGKLVWPHARRHL